ncbi:MAG TPA: glycosyltransferase [Bacteroidales bacterium]|nr:glycosyltransferase [Bacteroidales bacterium]
MKKILILAHDFPPYNSIGGQRPYSWYRYFHMHKLYPVVVTRHWGDEVVHNEDFYRTSVTQQVSIDKSETGCVIRVPVKANLRDRFIVKFGYRYAPIRKMLSVFYMLSEYLCNAFDPKSSIFKQADSYLLQHKVDYIIATGEPFILFKYASQLSRKHRIAWIADYRDCWSNNLNLGSFEKCFYRPIERRIMKSCTCIVTVSETYVEKIREVTGHKNIQTVYNGYWGEMFTDTLPKPDNESMCLFYSGTIYPYQRLEIFLEGMRKFVAQLGNPKFQMKFVGLEFFPEQLQRLKMNAKGLEAYVHTTPRFTLDQSITELKKADALLMLASESHFQLYAKVFEYLAVQKPVLMVVDDHGEVAEMLRSKNVGIMANTADEVCNALAKLYLKWENDDMPAYNYCTNQYTRETQAAKYCSLLWGLSGN